jgi:hypothetical protein
MKRLTIIALPLTLALIVSACAANATPAPASGGDAYASPNLDSAYDEALPARNQLALGTLELDGTPNGVTPQQAATLLPLWQALLSTQKSGAAAQAEVSALLAQVEGTLTPGQLAAINEMQLTQTDLQEWAAAHGVALGSGTGQPGSGQGLSPEARATRQAAEGRTPDAASANGGVSSAVLDAVITYLESLSS